MTGPLAQLFAQVRTVVPSTEEIERRMSQAQAVLDDPDEYPREYFGDARREITRCERLRAIDAALSAIERHVQDMEKALRSIEEPMHFDDVETLLEDRITMQKTARQALAALPASGTRNPRNRVAREKEEERGCAACDGDPEAHGLHVCGREF